MEEKHSQCLRFYTRKRKKSVSDLTTTSDKLMVLPESILHLILSFLDMKQVVQTSCLSTKWRNIWRSVPVLNFDYTSTEKNELRNKSSSKKLMDIVDHVLFLRDDSSIQKLKFFRFFRCDSGRVDAWLLFVIKQQVKEILLKIGYPTKECHQLPNLLFTSVVEVFEISALSVGFLVELPNSMSSARQLRILKLESIILPKGDTNGELVISCPILEEMFLMSCSHHDLKLLSICAPQLNNLVIFKCHADSCKIKICTPNLASLGLFLSRYKDYFFESLSSLVTANIEVSELSTKFLMTILNGIHNAKALIISNYGRQECCSFEDMEEDWGEVLSMQTIFSHLKYIRVLEFCGCENEVKLLGYLLKTAPGLQSMAFMANSWKTHSKSKIWDKFTEKLHSLPRASSSAIILFP